jgi:signal transduction histidine kinase
VLSFARKGETAREKCSIRDVIEETAVLKRYSLKNNNVQLHFLSGQAEPLHVFGYRNQLMQVLLNLINNAEQAIVDSSDKGTITLRAAKAGGQAMITVSDTGPGVAPEDQGRIFDAFFTTKEKNRGTGMGLYICRNIIRKHGGELNLLESRPGETVFRIRLPLHAPGAAGGEAAESAWST